MNRDENPARNRPTAVFIIGLLAGLLMLLSGRVMSLTDHMGERMVTRMNEPGFAERQTRWMWETRLVQDGQSVLWTSIGVLSACVVILGAFIIYTRPGRARLWGAIIILATAGAFLTSTGGAFAAVLGLTAGVMALLWTPRKIETE